MTTTMKRTYHVRVSLCGAGMWTTQVSCDTYEQARERALAIYHAGWFVTDDAIEVTHGGLTVWGPFIKGSAYIPTNPTR